MIVSRFGTPLLLSIAIFVSAASAAPPSFRETASPEGWTIVKGQAEAGLRSQGGKPLEIRTTAPLALPVEALLRFRAAAGDTITVQAVEEDASAAPLLECGFAMQTGNQAAVTAKSSGSPMATVGKSARRWDYRDSKVGWLNYAWWFPQVKNIWNERDFKEIGEASARMTPLAEKVFTLRMTVTADTRQIWLDDRLVAEDRVANSKPVMLDIQVTKTAKVISADFSAPAENGPFLPLVLESYSHLKIVQDSKAECAAGKMNSVPMRVPKTAYPDINLGDSLDRYRLTSGSGPDAGYVSATCAWPDAFLIDPAMLTFRVPYRNYQNLWLLAWVDERPSSVAKGTLRFYHETAGYPAMTDFEISPDAIQKGLVTKLAQKTANGKQLYLVKVPVNTEGLYGMRDRADQYLEFDLSKPVMLARSYPDPIFYGYFPAGLPSSIHVVGITMEEAPFGLEVQSKPGHFIFERPEKPTITVAVTNTTGKALVANVSGETVSYDGSGKCGAKRRVSIEPGKSGDAVLTFDLEKFGWHAMKVTVEAGGATRSAALSLVLLPRDTCTHGDALNEGRFGMWSLDGHYTSHYSTIEKGVIREAPGNARYMEAYRRLGLRQFSCFHSIGRNFAGWNRGQIPDAEAQKKMLEPELAGVLKAVKCHDVPYYFYGGEWGVGTEAAEYGPYPLYTGDGDRPLDPAVRWTAERQVQIFTAIGKMMREKCPQARLSLQWGAVAASVAHLRCDISKDVVDGFGMDCPLFELLPEASNVVGSMNMTWMLRADAKRLGWRRLPIAWCEGPFFPTCPAALTQREQMDYQVRSMLLALAYGFDTLISGIVPQDAGNYYGAEHYGAGIIERYPLENPKPAVAAVATMTQMLCGTDPVGGVDTGCPTTYCLEFERAKDHAKIYALWRIRGKVDARIKVRGSPATVTDAMGNAAKLDVKAGGVRVSLSPTPVWLAGVEKIEGFEFGAPSYDSAPAKVTRPLAEMSADNWTYDGSADNAFACHHFAVRRITDPNLKAEFGQGEKDYADAVAIVLPLEDGDRPMAIRYGALKPKKPITIPGKASALGTWIKGNSSWGRVIYQLRDAKGQTWISAGTKNNWNCDDTHGWASVNFEGWRYVRFPLPGNAPWDGARDLETTWWGSSGGDGIVALPLTVEKIFVEARNEVPVLGEMKVVPERSYKLSHLVAEYDSEADATPAAIVRNKIRMPLPTWTGPTENPIARLIVEGVGAGPEIKGFEEPLQEKDGRQMHIRFDQSPGLKYNLYMGRFPDGRGAERIVEGVSDHQLVTGLRPEAKMYLFLTRVNAQKKESKPSKAFELLTHDRFLEK